MRCGGSEHKSRLDRVRRDALEFLESVLTRLGYTLWERWPASFRRPWALYHRWLTFDGMCHAILPFAAWRGNLHGVRFWRVGEGSLRGPYSLLRRTIARRRHSRAIARRNVCGKNVCTWITGAMPLAP